jgi:hypothetical protein
MLSTPCGDAVEIDKNTFPKWMAINKMENGATNLPLQPVF